MESISVKSSVLSKRAIQRKIQRMALEVAERNIDEKSLIVAGIQGNGEIVAEYLIREMQKIISVDIQYLQVKLNKKQPGKIIVTPDVPLNDKTIILVDDVSNTGKTMLYALKPFLDQMPKKIQTCVLVERSHKIFPVQTDYFGLSISTTLQEHILVESIDGELTGAWLF